MLANPSMGIALNISWSEIQEMDWPKFNELLERLGQTRKRQEAKFKQIKRK